MLHPNCFRKVFTLAGVMLFSIHAFAAQSVAPTITAGERRSEAELARIRNNPPELYAWLLRMPKGADLHNHLAGAVYAETYLEEAVQSNLCVRSEDLSLQRRPADGSCPAGQTSAAEVQRNNELSGLLIDSLSMRDFVPGEESGHDHFFATFEKFNAASHGHEGEDVAKVVARAAEQNESYLELMALSGGGTVSQLGTQAGLDGGFEAARQRLLAVGLEERVKQLVPHVDAMEHGRISLLHCETEPTSNPCQVKVRYIYQVLRNSTKEEVFAQIVAGFMLARMDHRVVAVNLVQPEDYFTSMHDYHLHMQMLEYARKLFPDVHLTLHAGELAAGLVPPAGLRFHIREAVTLAHAERIGHGVDIAYEDDSAATLHEMSKRKIAVEINLTSNDLILGVRGDAHPFKMYQDAGVPITLSTDDEGVSRTHLTEEYERAVRSYGLRYADLKRIVRNGLQYSFLPGTSYWADGNYRKPVADCVIGKDTAHCKQFLAGSEKAQAQADLENRFQRFESQNSAFSLQ